MKPSTVTALDQINRRFYDREAHDFDQTRHGPWAGWRRVVDTLQGSSPLETPFHVLDLGCGNGRFGRFLADAMPETDLRWAGLDASPPLLERARSNVRGPNLLDPLTRPWNLLGEDGTGSAPLPTPSNLWTPKASEDRAGTEDRPPGGFDLSVAFGVFHHVPGPLQAALYARMVEATRPGGLIIVSFWQFAELRRYAARRIPWSEAVQADWIDAEAVDELDDDDWLLRWGGDGPLRARYCRFTDQEAASVVVSGRHESIERTDWFRADGRTGTLNLYAVAVRS